MPFHPRQPSQNTLFILQVLAGLSSPPRSLPCAIQAESSLPFVSQLFLEDTFIDTLTSEHGVSVCVCLLCENPKQMVTRLLSTLSLTAYMSASSCKTGSGSHSCLYSQPAPDQSINFHAGQDSSEQDEVPILVVLLFLEKEIDNTHHGKTKEQEHFR